MAFSTLTLGGMIHGERTFTVKKSLIYWDGRNTPEALKALPPGEYALEVVDETSVLTEEQEEGIRESLQQLDAGLGISLAELVASIREGNARK